MTTEDTDQTDCSGAVPEADFFVSPEGDDTWSGTSSTPASDGTDGPFATLIRARDAVRALRAQGDAEPDRDLFVLVRGGTYPLRETIVFGLRDSSPEGTTTTYAAYPGERPVFTSEVPVTGWRRV